MTPDEYEQFRHDAVHALMDLNEDCKRRYGITTWPRWDYDLDAGNLVFSDGGASKVVASIQVVGTTSNTSHTWMWAWANESLPMNVTEQVREVRQFGITEGLSGLTEPQPTDDEFLGWEMTAIMARIVGAKGAYRYPRDNGFTYVVYKDINVTDSQAGASPKPASDEGKVACAAHGPGQQTFVCEHLVLDPKQRWFSDGASVAKPWPDAWCAKCDELLPGARRVGRRKFKSSQDQTAMPSVLSVAQGARTANAVYPVRIGNRAILPVPFQTTRVMAS